MTKLTQRITTSHSLSAMEHITFWLRKLSLARDRSSIENIVSEACRTLIHAHHVQFVYFDAPTHNSKTTNVKATPQQQIQHLLVRPDNRAFLVNDDALLTQLMPQGLSNSDETSVWMIPLRAEEPIGVLLCELANASFDETPNGINAAQIITESAAIALENANVSEQLARLVAERTAELAIARQEAENKSQMKSRFLSAASHDLRQPLQQITSLINILTRQQTTSDGIKHLSRAKQIVQGMERLVNRLLNLDELEEGKVKPRIQDVLLSPLFQKLEDDFTQQAQEKSLQLTFTADNVNLHTDADLLLQMLRNLIGNAIKYTPSGFVRVQGIQQNDYVELIVEDSGPGIRPALQELVFEPFYQIRDTRQHSASFGLGLAFVKSIAEVLCVPVSVFSDGKHGTRFTLQVPGSKAEMVELIEQTPSVIQTESIARGCVLYLEDDDVLAESISILLEMEKFNVITADSLSQAQQKLTESDISPDVIVTDLNLHGSENGLDAIQQLRLRYHAHIPAILLTGYTEHNIQDNALKVVQKVLNKPIDADELIVEIEQLQTSPDARP
ncbi:hybrid sensor histidine kinase/response regulator [Alteromonas sp. a30]|uniref:hybrid sensor histidine kinase/response regulator n=1 Tax=Alteromonas sp. a30 TaxID=2730917 RepID=UPI002280B251|nr:hybrid sensor histidine kinase/response regulator [Alteromonas sp. a30]MCY7296459.1 hybrid sensor histidine kinase/response regulator [Alteromonas sp. a30]